MSIAFDASTTPWTKNPGSPATLAVTPPQNSVLLLVFTEITTADPVASVTDTFANHLTWSEVIFGTDANHTSVSVWRAYNSFSGQTGNVVATLQNGAGNTTAQAGVIVLTGAASSQAGAASGYTDANDTSGPHFNGTSGPSYLTGATLTTTANGSQVIAVGSSLADYVASAPTIPSGQTDDLGGETYSGDNNGGNGGVVLATTAPTPTSGTAVTLNITAPTGWGTTAIVEILAAAGTTPNPQIASGFFAA